MAVWTNATAVTIIRQATQGLCAFRHSRRKLRSRRNGDRGTASTAISISAPGSSTNQAWGMYASMTDALSRVGHQSDVATNQVTYRGWKDRK